VAADSASLLLRVRQILLCYPRVVACSLFWVTSSTVGLRGAITKAVS